MPLTIGLLVDVSGSQYNLIDIERQAAYQFFTQVLRKGDKAFLISFRENVELLQDFTSSPRLQALTHCRTSWTETPGCATITTPSIGPGIDPRSG